MNEAEIRAFFDRLRAAMLAEDPTEAELKALAVQGIAIVEIIVVKLASAK